MPIFALVLILTGLAFCSLASGNAEVATAPDVNVTGDWQVRVGVGQVQLAEKLVTIVTPATIIVSPAPLVSVTAERHDALPVFNAGAAGWAKGVRLQGVVTQETSAKGYLDPESVEVTSTPDSGITYTRDADYALDCDWGTFGRLPGGRINEHTTVYVRYRHGLGRLDTLVVQRNGTVELRLGLPAVNVPQPAPTPVGTVALAHIWVPGRLAHLSAEQIFPIMETAYPHPAPPVADQLLPTTLQKLRNGKAVTILAWGDSVTEGSFLPAPETDRWQAQFVTRLRVRFPKAHITLVNLGWGGRNTESFLNEPPGSPFNYAEKVLGVKPDLIVSEFVNDAGLSPEGVEARYSKLLADFHGIGAEWIILTPHYVRPDWMDLTRERDIDTDPRPYVAGLRQFAARHHVALADAALRWGRLWRQGIPYTTLLLNAINHPDAHGMRLFADSLLDIFPEK